MLYKAEEEEEEEEEEKKKKSRCFFRDPYKTHDAKCEPCRIFKC